MEPMRVAVFGTSFGRAVHAPGFLGHPGFRLVAIAGGNESSARHAAEDLEGVTPYGDWRRLLEAESPEVVSIATPVDLHHPMAIAALERGSHVLCEKPIALHRHQAAEMRDAARRAGRVAGINHEFRFLPARAHALALVRRGAIGTPRRGEILGRYSLWARAWSRGWSWLSDRSRGGGILGALGSHHVDALRLFFGEPTAVTASVRVDQPMRGPVPGQPETRFATADDACTLQLEFEGGASALLDLSACAPYRWERFEIHGSEASLRWEESGERLWRIEPGREPELLDIPESLRLESREDEPPLLAPFRVMVGRFHDALCGLQPMEPDFDDAVAVQSVLDAARASSDAGTRMRIDLPASAAPEAG
jgi:predicted dehydrogenase